MNRTRKVGCGVNDGSDDLPAVLAIASDKGETTMPEDATELYDDIEDYFILLTDKKCFVGTGC